MSRLIAFLYRRFGLRARRLPMAVRRRSPYAPDAPFTVVQRDGVPMIEMRVAR